MKKQKKKERVTGINASGTVLAFLVSCLAAASGCHPPSMDTLDVSMLSNKGRTDTPASAITRKRTLAVRTVEFPRGMNTTVHPDLLAESHNGLGWVEIPTTGTTLTWTNDKTLAIGMGWNQFPENATMRFTISGLQNASGASQPAYTVNFTTSTAPVTFGISDTGQTDCYDTVSIQPCPQIAWPGQDGDVGNSPAPRDFTDPAAPAAFAEDAVTIDRGTGVVWKACSEGLRGANCATGRAQAVSWYEALNACAELDDMNEGVGYAGRRGWRLPTIAEIERLVNFGTFDPAIDLKKFPGTAITRPFWSASGYGANGAYSWAVFFKDGDTTTYNRRRPGYVRCVTTEKGTAMNVSPNSHSDTGGGTIRDSRTGLIWQKCSSGLSGRNCDTGSLETYTWEGALRYCSNLHFAGRSWRLPSVNELKTLVDRSKNLPEAAVDSTYFPRTATSVYWTSTTYAPLTINAWYVGFGGGFGGPYRKTCHYYVRCVAGP